MKKKMWSVLLALCLALSLLPTAALADNEVAQIGETKYASLQAAVTAATDGATIELLGNASGDGVKFPEGGFATSGLTIDFKGFTYTVGGKCVGSTGTESNGFQILKGSKVTLKNGTLNTSATASGTYGGGTGTEYVGGARTLVMNYSNLTLDNMTLDGSTLCEDVPNYTLSNVCGAVTINNSTITGQTGGFAFDVDYKDSYSAGTQVTVSGNSTILGNIEVTSNPTSTLTINGGSFTDLATAVKYAADNATIKLAQSTSGGGIVFEADQKITIDFNGNTYTLDGAGVGSGGTQTNAFQCLKGGTDHDPATGQITFLNGTVNIAEKNKTYGTYGEGRNIVRLIQGYNNITLNNMTFDGTNLYKAPRDFVLSFNKGNVKIIGNTSIIGFEGMSAFDTCDGAWAGNAYNRDPLTDVYVNTTGTIVGDIAVDGGTLKVENANVVGGVRMTTAGTSVVTGGTFAVDPSAYVPEGYNICVNNGTYTVVLNSGLGAGTYLRQPAVSSECVWNQSGDVYNVYVFTAPAPSNPVAPSTPSTPSTPTEPTKPTEPSDEPSTPTSYPDVAPTDWYAPAVTFVTEKGLMSGTESGFEPDSTATRAMLWTILARLDGKDGSVEGGEWFTAAQLWSISAGISDGSDPHGTITREQLAVMLYRYAISLGLDVSVGANTNILSYGDAASVSDFALEAMQWACGTGIINGVGGNLDPQGNATRAQLATMLMRYVALFD